MTCEGNLQQISKRFRNFLTLEQNFNTLAGVHTNIYYPFGESLRTLCSKSKIPLSQYLKHFKWVKEVISIHVAFKFAAVKSYFSSSLRYLR